jgi:DNA-binding Lrp family transcriptional regulator
LDVTPSAGPARESAEDAAIARAVTRCSGDYVLRFLRLLFGSGDIRDAVVALAIAAANTAHLEASGGGWRYAAVEAPPPDEARRPVTVLSVAEALRLPFETTRRRVGRLLRSGACVRDRGGIIVPTAFLTRHQPSRALTNIGYVREFVRDLETAGLAEAATVAGILPAPEESAAVARSVTRLSARYTLSTLQLLIDTYGDVRTGIVAQTIVTANTTHLAAEMNEASRYAGIGELPPDEVRKPVSVVALARLLGLPYETTRAQVQRLIAAGVCTRVAGGVIVPTAVLNTPAAIRSTLANVFCVRKFMRDLHAASQLARDAPVVLERVARANP